jgi:thiamine biosynthesis lipoprotein
LTLQRGFVATSGDYATSFTPDFSHHHVFDPVRGISPQELASVTVIAPSGAEADALATAFMVMGKEAALAYAKTAPQIQLLLITKAAKIAASENLTYEIL